MVVPMQAKIKFLKYAIIKMLYFLQKKSVKLKVHYKSEPYIIIHFRKFTRSKIFKISHMHTNYFGLKKNTFPELLVKCHRVLPKACGVDICYKSYKGGLDVCPATHVVKQ